ncbi:MAG: anti-sigma factor antagonist [Firmicutes bacterium]|nr:anti-sigma factor antagonist [Bacillota bacterium]
MNLEVNTDSDVLLVRIKGEMDLASAEQIRSEVDRKFLAENCRHLLLDLTRVTFIDSSGIGVILGRYRRLSGGGGKMAILKPQPQVRRVLDIAGVSGLATYCRSEKEGIGFLLRRGEAQ